MALSNNAEMNRLVSRPFIIYSGTDLTGTATGDAEVRNYCALPYTSASRYQLDRPDHNNIFQFQRTINGVTEKAYCLDKFADGPYNDVPYESAPFETIFASATERQKQMLAWILANCYPAVSAQATFELTGTDYAASPVLDDNDAYAAVQVALWVLLGQIAPDEVNFLECSSTEQHPKSVRLRATVLRLLELAGEFADDTANPAPPVSANTAGCCTDNPIDCCNTGTIPTVSNKPYLVFKGCPDEVRTVCGRLLIGPFMLQSGFTGKPVITVEPICVCQEGFSASFMDFCGNKMDAPSIGDEFYIAVRTIKDYICFTVRASFTGTVTRVVTMNPTGTGQNYQPIGTTFEDVQVNLEASVCVCASVPRNTEKKSHSQTGISINNNNNNNNNNNSNTNSNSGLWHGGMYPWPNYIIMCPPPGWYPSWPSRPPYPPEPPYPPYPPKPPYPPEPPYPPYPPEPPYPPYPPKPPYPPYPPKPPYPPYPPYPPKPPCPPEPPCPPKPPCPPEPPCPPKPPCPPEPPCPPKPSCPLCPPCCPLKSECSCKNGHNAES